MGRDRGQIYEHIISTTIDTCRSRRRGHGGRTVTINSLSKTYSVTGWRVG
jgi:aspartate/methionine/tyrosine aminotransferase